MSEISNLIKKMYGHYYRPQTISHISKMVSGDILAFKERPLEDKYSVIFIDATYLPLKRQTVSKEAIYIVIGIHSVYPNAQFQQCCVDVFRNISHKDRVKDRKEICDDFKAVYQSASKEKAIEQVTFMTDKCKK